jgi:hypothetical protein
MGCAPSSTIDSSQTMTSKLNQLEKTLAELQKQHEFLQLQLKQSVKRVEEAAGGKNKNGGVGSEGGGTNDGGEMLILLPQNQQEIILPGSVNRQEIIIAPLNSIQEEPFALGEDSNSEQRIRRLEEDRRRQMERIERLEMYINGSSVSPPVSSPVAPAASSASGDHPLPTSTLPPPARIATPEEKKTRHIEFDVFLSHKRTDCADFARTLQTELTDNFHLKCFLDQDADFELGDLMAKVRASSNLYIIGQYFTIGMVSIGVTRSIIVGRGCDLTYSSWSQMAYRWKFA